VKLPPYVKKRGNVYWFRRRVPEELIPVVGRAEFMETLRTTDVNAARTKAAYRNAEVEAEFARGRITIKRQAVVPILVETPTPEEQHYIRAAVRAHVLEEDESMRMARPDDDTVEAYQGIRSDQFDEAVRALQSGRVAWGREEKARFGKLLAAVGVQVTPGTPAWDIVTYKAAEGLHEALKDIGSRINGNFVSTPPRPATPVTLAPNSEESAPTSAAVTLGDVIDHYLKGLPSNDFKRKVRRCLQLFGEMLGRDLNVNELRQKAVTDFMRDICRLPDKWARRFDTGVSIKSMLAEETEKVMSPSTYEGNYRGPLGTFLTSAARDFGDDGFRLLTVGGIKYTGDRQAEEDQQRALTDGELKSLFEGGAFLQIARDPKQEPLYWLLVAMLFTGARPREVCQLNPQADFGKFEGHWYIDLDEKSLAGVGVKKSIKTGEARRVPLHAELVRLGFPEYLQRMKESGADRLFPSWRVKGGNPYTAHYQLVAGLLKDIGLYTRSAPPGEQVTGAYTLRKTFITQCRNHGVVSKEITGHHDGSTTAIQDRHYVFGPEPFERKLSELKKLVLPITIPIASY